MDVDKALEPQTGVCREIPRPPVITKVDIDMYNPAIRGYYWEPGMEHQERVFAFKYPRTFRGFQDLMDKIRELCIRFPDVEIGTIYWG